MELTGTWRAAPADDDLRRSWHDDRFDDSGWEPLEVPGHWRSSPAFADHDGPLLYRRAFEAPATGEGRRSWLTFEGLFYQGDVWLDGAYLGDTEGYFAPHTFEVTEALRARAEHHLAIEVTCAPQLDKTAKRNITGVFQHWDCLDPDWNPGGLWRPVRLTETGPVRIARLRVVCREATPQRAVLVLRATLDSDGARRVRIETRVGDHDEAADHPLAAGANEVEWTHGVDRPALWWPRALGDALLQDLAVRVVLPSDEGGGVSDERQLRTGLRQVRMRSWVASVNGERLFLKGSNQGPTRMALGEATAAELARDVELALDAGLDLLRVHAHISRPELYDAADEQGLLLWQDLPLQWGYARGIRKQAVRQATQAVDLLGHHPSIAIWCGHNEPMAIENDPAMWGDPKALRSMGLKALAAQQLPTWNKTVLDRSVKRALEQADGSRPVVAHSGVLPHPPMLDGTDSHLYFGWYHGHERDLPGFLRAVPRMGRFVTELGAQAVPATAAFMEPERWPDLDWDRLGHTHALQKALFDKHVPPASHTTFESWRDATQAYQATVVRRQIEALRRIKYRPTGGFAQFCFADGHPAVTWSVLDHERVPKAGYDALRAACAPVIVVADRPPETVAPGEALALDVHVVSDLRHPLEGLVVTAELTWAGGHRSWRWQGDLPADACQLIGTAQIVVPDARGDLRLVLTCREGKGGTVLADNEYVSHVSG
ncbi:MAG: glycosyl hydrolase 2 galactose-binding domain-containing protein [Acidimicrobiia bacterium]